jgi:hypothetical protein
MARDAETLQHDLDEALQRIDGLASQLQQH